MQQSILRGERKRKIIMMIMKTNISSINNIKKVSIRPIKMIMIEMKTIITSIQKEENTEEITIAAKKTI